MENDERDFLLQMSFDAWKFQIEAYWTRTSYFAVFELALATGVWEIFQKGHWLTVVALTIGAMVVSAIWFINNSRLHEYILYYLGRLKHYESLLPLGEEGIFSPFELLRKKCIPGSYHIYIQILPILFFLGWLWMMIWSICSFHSWFLIAWRR